MTDPMDASTSDAVPVDTALAAQAVADPTRARCRHDALILTAVLPAPQEELWRWLVEPELLRQWSPVVPEHALDQLGGATSREGEGAEAVDATVTDVRGPWFLEHRWGPDRLTWQLAPSGDGTQLNLVQELSRVDSAPDMAAGWHLCLTVLRRLLQGEPTRRCVGRDAVAHGWPQLREHYAELLAPATDEQS